MPSLDPEFENFYDDQVQAYRQIYHRETVWDRLSQPSIILSILIFLVTVVYNAYGSTASLEGTVSLIGTCLWDSFVFLVPESLLNALDSRANPTLIPRPMSGTQGTHAAKSETMRRVLGLDRSGGVMASVFQVRNRALSMTGSVLGLKLDTEQPAGLGNRDNSCYQNSILQGLASLKTLPEYLSSHLQAASAANGDQDVAQTLRTLISDLHDASNNGKTLWTPGVLKNMSTWTQQDAQEYYSKILDDIDKSVAKASKSMQRHPGFGTSVEKDDTATSQHSDDSGYQSVAGSNPDTKSTRNPLEGLLAQRVACVQCGHSDGLSMIPFTCLTLSLGLDKNQHDLYERLDAYSKVESIENVECGKCTLLKMQKLLSTILKRMRESDAPDAQLAEPIRRLEAVELALEEDDFDERTLKEKCKIQNQNKVSTTKTKQIVVARPPQSLAIHVNRSVFDPSTFNMMKNSAPVNFPKTLDLGPWCLGSASDMTSEVILEKETRNAEDDEERWISDPRESMVAGDLRPSRLSGPIYELRAVVTHYGRHENGHYICYRKHRRNLARPNKLADEKSLSEPEDDDDEAIAVPEAPSQQEAREDAEADDDFETDWWRLSDHNVSMVKEETVLSLSPGVFMLFYDCVDPNVVLASDDGPMLDAEEGAEPTLTGTAANSDSIVPSGTENAPELEEGSNPTLNDPQDRPQAPVDRTEGEIAETRIAPPAELSAPETGPLPSTELPDAGAKVPAAGPSTSIRASNDGGSLTGFLEQDQARPESILRQKTDVPDAAPPGNENMGKQAASTAEVTAITS